MSVSSPKKKYVVNGEKQCNDMAQQFLIQPLNVINVLNANMKILLEFFEFFKFVSFYMSVKGKQVNNSLMVFFLFFSSI